MHFRAYRIPGRSWSWSPFDRTNLPMHPGLSSGEIATHWSRTFQFSIRAGPQMFGEIRSFVGPFSGPGIKLRNIFTLKSGAYSPNVVGSRPNPHSLSL